jgi:hypothetical protein
MRDLTVIYYTSNREDITFESQIQADLYQKIGGISLISVSQKPVRFGKNICVGDVGVSDYNIYRQIQIGCLEAKTTYVCTAESDCLYPPTGYFDFRPPEDWTAGHYTNLYILWKGSHIFNQKAFSLCGLFSNREFLLSRFSRSLGVKQWRPNYKPQHPLFHKWKEWTPFQSDIPIINIKTGDGMRIKSGVNTEGRPVKELPYWGSAEELEKKIWKIYQ